MEVPGLGLELELQLQAVAVPIQFNPLNRNSPPTSFFFFFLLLEFVGQLLNSVFVVSF